MIGFLADHGNVAAIEALARHAGKQSVDLRLSIIYRCGDRMPGGAAQGTSGVLDRGQRGGFG